MFINNGSMIFMFRVELGARDFMFSVFGHVGKNVGLSEGGKL